MQHGSQNLNLTLEGHTINQIPCVKTRGAKRLIYNIANHDTFYI